jgi:hypothetical protein
VTGIVEGIRVGLGPRVPLKDLLIWGFGGLKTYITANMAKVQRMQPKTNIATRIDQVSFEVEL